LELGEQHRNLIDSLKALKVIELRKVKKRKEKSNPVLVRRNFRPLMTSASVVVMMVPLISVKFRPLDEKKRGETAS
jgi:hypothetical protein